MANDVVHEHLPGHHRAWQDADTTLLEDVDAVVGNRATGESSDSGADSTDLLALIEMDPQSDDEDGDMIPEHTQARKKLELLEAERAEDESRVRYEGFLRKRYSSSMYMGSWRYCIVQGHRLRWYMTQDQARADTQLRGEVWVRAVEPWNGHGSVNVYPHAFAIRTTSNRVLLCSAKTTEDKQQWLGYLQSCLSQDKSSQSAADRQTHHYDAAEYRRIVPEDALRNASSNATTAPPGSAMTAVAMSPEARPLLLPPPNAAASGTSSAVTLSPSASSLECLRCAVRFKTLSVRRYICGSCAQSFCSRHCNAQVRLHHLGLRTTRRCCSQCAQRQAFLLHLEATARFFKTLLTDSQQMNLLLGKSGELQADSKLHAQTLVKLRRGPMSLIRTVKILYQTRKKPLLFRAACERLPFYVENCIDRVESLWYQILHLFQCCDSDVESSKAHLMYLKRFVRAICRRSPRIALQTIWHIQAAAGDASRMQPHSLLALLGFLYPSSDTTASSQLWKDLLLAQCPSHQKAELLTALDRVNVQSEQIIEQQEDTPLERWLNASTVEEFERTALELSMMGIDLCDFHSSIVYDSLCVDRSSRGPSQLQELVFDQVSFVQSLAAISERLRHIQPVEDRGNHLEQELTQLNEGLDSSALYPLCTASDELYRVIRIPPTEGKVFSTKMRAPTLIFIETVPVDSSRVVEGDEDRLRAFIGSSKRINSMFMESLNSVDAPGETSSRDSLLSSGESSNGTSIGVCALRNRHGSQLSSPDDLDQISQEDEAENDRSTMAGSELAGDSRSSERSTIVRGGRSSTGLSFPRGTSCARHGVDNLVYDSNVYGESWEDRTARIQSESPVGHMPGWRLFSVIVKTNDDLRQEMFTMQLINKIKAIFEAEKLDLWLQSYRIVATGANIGLLETITDACSLDHLKKTFLGGNLFEYFKSVYGQPDSPEFEVARKLFIYSMAAYSIVSYVLLVKDRHNGNILLNSRGQIVHIDFGFILGIAPGGMFSIEDAPFKLTEEMAAIMGGIDSPGFALYRRSMCDGFAALQRYHSELAALLQTTGQHSPFPCFEGTKLARVITDLRGRLCVGLSNSQIERRVDALVRKSYNAWGTRKYDSFQLRSNNIHP